VGHAPLPLSATSTFGLLERFRRGDQSAFTQLFEKYRRRLAVLIHYKLGEEARRALEVDDLLQDTFLRACRDLGKFSYASPGSFFRWLASIADHVVIDAVRSRERAKRRAAAPVETEPVDSKTPSRLLAEKQRAAALIGALDQLPDQYRSVILLAKMEGLSTGQVADRLGKSREATALLLHRALKRLKTLSTGKERR